MFKLNESVFDEVAEQLEKNLNKFAFDKASEKDQKLVEALELLNKSAEYLEQFGFNKEADAITKLIVLAAKKKKVLTDPHTKGLTSKKMLHNLATKGMEFNADDGEDKLPSHAHGYPLIYLTEKDEVLCPECATEVKKEGNKVTGHLHEEGPTERCKICQAPLESAYGDPEEVESEVESDNLHEHPEAHKREKLEHGYDEILDEMKDRDEDKVFI